MVATTRSTADELAAPLDLLLTSSAVGMADRMMPNVAWSRFALNLAKQPRTVASRRHRSAGSWCRSPRAAPRWHLPRATRDSPIRRGGAIRCYTAPCRLTLRPTTLWINCSRMRTSTGAMPSESGLSWTFSARDFRRATIPCSTRSAGRPSSTPAGGVRCVGLRNFVGDMASAPRVPSMIEPDAFTLGETIAVTPGSVVLRCRGIRADPVRAANREGLLGAAAHGAAGDQQVLHHGHLAWPQHDRVLPAAGHPGLRDLVAQSHCGAAGIGASTRTARRS